MFTREYILYNILENIYYKKGVPNFFTDGALRGSFNFDRTPYII